MSDANAILDRAVQGVIGQPADRIDGPLKVSGTATYAYEVQRPGTAYGHVLSATIGRGQVTAIDAAAARAAPGVLAVITDHPLLPADSPSGQSENGSKSTHDIRAFGEPLGIVVAESFEAARAAAGLVRVDYAPTDGRFDPAAETEVIEDPKIGFLPNIRRGDLDAALAAATHRYDATFTTPIHFPHALEPHATLAEWEGDQLTVHASLQVLGGARQTIADALDLDVAQVRVLARYVGGGFGGKTGVGPETILAAIAAREIGRPVKVALTRRQTGQLVHHRSWSRQRLRIGCDADGHISVMAQESVVAQKPGRTFLEPVHFGTIHLYAGEVRHFTTGLVEVDLPNTGAVRAPGEAIGTLALETAMDELAEQLGLDPIELRIRNEPDVSPMNGKPFSTRRLCDCYEEGARRFGWSKRHPVPGSVREGEWLIGMGMATALRGNFSVESRARLRLEADGTATVETDMTDIGTGTYTILAQVAGEMLGLPLSQVRVVLGDTNLPPGAGSGGSFGAGSSGSAVALAGETIIAELARRMDANPEDLTLKDGHAIARNRRMPLTELLGGAPIEAEGHTRRGPAADATTQASHGAHFAEVAVNVVTGEVRVRRMTGVFDIGRVLNAKTARSQIVGGILWGLSAALFEHAVADTRTGQFMNPDLAEYHVVANADAPPIDVHFIEEPDVQANEVGAKGVGELGNSGAGAAVTNAIYNACGVRVRDFPLTLDKILPGLPPL